ncbi:MAG: two-component regulator propeller domain-containing protein [Acidobacteriota bacterium]
MARIPVAYVILVLPMFSAAAPGRPASGIQFEHLTVNEGLSESAVTTLIQDRQGFIWIGTHDGLNRFDGNTVIIFKNDPEDPNSLSDNTASAICEDEDGMLWIGTFGGGLNRFNPATGTSTRYRHDKERPGSLGGDRISGLLRDRRGRLWVSHDAGIDRYSDPENRFVRISSLIGWLIEDRSGSVWLLVRPDKLYRFDEDSGHFAPFPLPLPEKEHSAEILGLLYLSRSGTLLIMTHSRICRFNLVEGRLFDERDPIPVPPGIQLKMACSAVETQSGDILVGTFGDGLIEIRGDNQIHRLVHDPSDSRSLCNDNIVHILEDRSGIIWISTEGGGVSLIKKDKTVFPHYRHVQGSTRSISGNYVTAIYKDAGGDLWIGTGGAGLNRIREADGTYTVFKHDPERPRTSLSNDTITSISSAAELGYLWIGTNDGLNKLHLETGTFTHFKHDPAKPGSLSDNQIFSAFLDSRGHLWVIAHVYLDRLPLGESEFVHYRHDPGVPESISEGPGYPIYEDRSGTIWIGSWYRGLNRYDHQSDTFQHFSHDAGKPGSLSHDRVWAIHEDRRGRIWIGTYGGGLNLFDRSSGGCKRYLEKDGLANNVIYGILEDEEGCLWMSTNNGLSCFNPDTETFRNFDVDNGLQSREFNTRAFFRDGTGKMYFGGINGYNAFYPGDVRTNRHRPPVVITSIIASGRRIVPAAVPADGAITLGYDQNWITFEFAALDYNSPSKNRFAYRLESLDKDWNRVGADRRFADYRNIPPGDYTFRVRGSNNDGIWNEVGVSVPLRVLPPFWGTWWFRTVALIAFGLIFYFFVTFLKKHFYLIEFWKTRTIIGDYLVSEKIGSGGMGVVYKGTSRKDRSKVVALKVLSDEHFRNESLRRRFINEGSIVDSLDHPHIVKIYQRDCQGDNPYIAMEFLNGRTLQEKMDREGVLSLAETGDIMRQLVEVIAVIHGQGIVHRDLKPENIMLVQHDGRDNFVKMLDFGLAIMKNATRLTRSGMFMGTLAYTPPEQAAGGTQGTPGDIYSMGVILYEMVTGEKPFFGETSLEIIKQILNEDPVAPITFNPDIPGGLNDLIQRMLSKNPNDRPTADELRNTLPQLFSEP